MCNIEKTIDLGNGTFCKIDGEGNKYWFRIDDSRMWHATGQHYIIQDFNQEAFYRMPMNEVLHRTDGPALERINGDNRWYINAKAYSEEEFDIIKEVLWAL